MSTEIHEKIKVRKLFCFFIKYRKFQQFYFRNLFLLFRNSSSIPLRFISLRAFDTAMPVRFASLHLTAGFRRSHASSIPLRSISLRAFDTAMPVRFRFAPSHCGLSPQPCQFDSASLHLTAGFRPIQEETDRWFCASTTSGPSLPVHGSMLIACFRQTLGCRQSRL